MDANLTETFSFVFFLLFLLSSFKRLCYQHLPFSVAVSLHLQTQFGEVLGKNGCKA